MIMTFETFISDFSTPEEEFSAKNPIFDVLYFIGGCLDGLKEHNG